MRLRLRFSLSVRPTCSHVFVSRVSMCWYFHVLLHVPSVDTVYNVYKISVCWRSQWQQRFIILLALICFWILLSFKRFKWMQTSIEKLNTVPKKTTANKKLTLLFKNFESICLTLWNLLRMNAPLLTIGYV